MLTDRITLQGADSMIALFPNSVLLHANVVALCKNLGLSFSLFIFIYLFILEKCARQAFLLKKKNMYNLFLKIKINALKLTPDIKFKPHTQLP